MPKVTIIAMGGTIASVPAAAGSVPSLSAEELVSVLPQLREIGEITAESFRQIPSPDINLADVVDLAREVARQIDGGADGIVVTQGTDTLEESAFALDLFLTHEQPVVLTGAMRGPTVPGTDGPANLLAAVRLAASPTARGIGVLVVLNDEIHAARFVRKTHTSNPATFRSEPTGPIGWFSEGEPRITVRPARYHSIQVPSSVLEHRVAIVTIGMGEDGRLLDTLASAGYAGVVVEGTGGGHVPRAVAERLGALAAQMPIVLASRTGSGEILRRTYGFQGSEIDLLHRGLIPAGALDGLKARVLLSILLANGAEHAEIAEKFQDIGLPH